MALLTVTDLSSRRAGVDVLRHVSFSIGDEIMVVVGLNGSGKSTLLRTIAGLTPATSGQVLLRDVEITGRPCHVVTRSGVTLMPQAAHSFDALSVAENIRLGGYLLPRKEVKQEYERQLERFPRLVPRLKSPARVLSGGERQMLGLAKSLMARPELLLLDEPSAGLSPRAIDDVFESLARLRDDGMPMVLAEQNITRAAEIGDRALALYLGGLRSIVPLKGRPQSVSDLRAAMLGPA